MTLVCNQLNFVSPNSKKSSPNLRTKPHAWVQEEGPQRSILDPDLSVNPHSSHVYDTLYDGMVRKTCCFEV